MNRRIENRGVAIKRLVHNLQYGIVRQLKYTITGPTRTGSFTISKNLFDRLKNEFGVKGRYRVIDGLEELIPVKRNFITATEIVNLQPGSLEVKVHASRKARFRPHPNMIEEVITSNPKFYFIFKIESSKIQ